MIKATKEMFTKYAVFSGRTSRSDFWLAFLGYLILSFILGFIVGFIFGLTGSTINESTTNIISYGWSLATLLPVLGIEVRRLHDINKSGWLVLLGLIPIIGWIILIVFYCMPAVNEGNRY